MPVPASGSTPTAILEQWQQRLPAHLARNLARQRVRPLIHLELGNAELLRALGAMVREMTAALDSSSVSYTSEVFEGDHVDRTRARMSQFLLPAAGRYFRRRDPRSEK